MGKDKGAVKRPLPVYYRCQDDGNLLGEEMISKGVCAGHKIKYATKGTLWEKMLVLLKRIR